MGEWKEALDWSFKKTQKFVLHLLEESRTSIGTGVQEHLTTAIIQLLGNYHHYYSLLLIPT